MSFVENINKQSGGAGVFYVLVKDITERMAWYYVKVAPPKHAAFRKALEGPTDLDDWGEVLKSGYGERSPDDIREEMLEEYGFEHEGDK